MGLNYRSLTGFSEQVSNLDLKKYWYKSTPNSTCYKIPYQDSYLFIKVLEVPDKVTLMDDEQLLNICHSRNSNMLTHHDFIIGEEIADFGSVVKRVMVITDFVHNTDFFNTITYLHANQQDLLAFIDSLIHSYNVMHSDDILHKDVNINNIGFKKVKGKIEPIILDLNIYEFTSGGSIFTTPEFIDPDLDDFTNYSIVNERWAIGVLIYYIYTFNFPFYNRIKNSKKFNIEDLMSLRYDLLPDKYSELIKLFFRVSI